MVAASNEKETPAPSTPDLVGKIGGLFGVEEDERE
jgi:hypothetical protein